ncbi:MAG TPA: VWA domain-containing protein [Thermoanaerobaculia bacterium]|nr:VWA domain-containing protein [Thermoanaerobaculia bacterium]
MGTRERTGRVLAILLTIFAASASGEILPRLLLTKDAPGRVPGDYRGATEIVVVPPFEAARVTLELNGNRIATLTRAPYRLEADLGSESIQQTIRVTASAPGRKGISWESIINAGKSPLSIRLIRRDGTIEALVTERDNDPAVEVTFFHDVHPLGTRTSPPWVVEAPAEQTALLHATVRSRSGAEATDVLTPNAEVMLADYEWKRVDLQVSVVDGRGSVVDGLDVSKFRVVDNGEPGKIVGFGRVFDQPVSVSLVLDASASMTGYMPAVSVAARHFVEKIAREQDRISVYSVHDVPRRWSPLTEDRAAVLSAIGGIRSGGNTALWDAIATSLRELESEPRKKALVLLSDGADTDSIRSWKEIVEIVRHSAIPLYAIAFNEDPRRPSRHRDQLRYLAAESGGFVLDANESNLGDAWRRIEEDLRARYLISYEVFAPFRENEWRNVKVSLASPELNARAIRGYVAR